MAQQAGLAIDHHGRVHLLAFVVGALIVVLILWDAFETLSASRAIAWRA